ncbi:MAG: hypothetical protein ACI4U1_06840 [Anaerovoracaceae bacterium]
MKKKAAIFTAIAILLILCIVCVTVCSKADSNDDALIKAKEIAVEYIYGVNLDDVGDREEEAESLIADYIEKVKAAKDEKEVESTVAEFKEKITEITEGKETAEEADSEDEEKASEEDSTSGENTSSGSGSSSSSSKPSSGSSSDPNVGKTKVWVVDTPAWDEPIYQPVYVEAWWIKFTDGTTKTYYSEQEWYNAWLGNLEAASWGNKGRVPDPAGAQEIIGYEHHDEVGHWEYK